MTQDIKQLVEEILIHHSENIVHGGMYSVESIEMAAIIKELATREETLIKMLNDITYNCDRISRHESNDAFWAEEHRKAIEKITATLKLLGTNPTNGDV